jgi:hypothetical protein
VQLSGTWKATLMTADVIIAFKAQALIIKKLPKVQTITAGA